MKDDYLVPPIVADIANSLLAETTKENERANYYRRIVAIRAFCDIIIAKADKKVNR